jgi:hypothetical protein
VNKKKVWFFMNVLLTLTLILSSCVITATPTAATTIPAKPDWVAGQPRPAATSGIGDINMDGYVGPDDVAAVENISLGKPDPATGLPYTADQIRHADANGDGVVNVGDIARIQAYYEGNVNTLP